MVTGVSISSLSTWPTQNSVHYTSGSNIPEDVSSTTQRKSMLMAVNSNPKRVTSITNSRPCNLRLTLGPISIDDCSRKKSFVELHDPQGCKEVR